MFESCKEKYKNVKLYDNIRTVYITMKSMEAKHVLQHFVFREDGRIPEVLREVSMLSKSLGL